MPVQTNDRGLRGKVDDASAALAEHVSCAGLGDEETGLEVDLQRRVPGLFADVDSLVQHGYPGTVDQIIDALEMLEDAVDGAVDLIDPAQVDRNTNVPAAQAGGDLGHCRVTVQQCDPRPACDQQAGTGKANPGCSAGDDRTTAIEIERLVPEFRHEDDSCSAVFLKIQTR